jgi:hypothetical protein
MQNPHTTVSGYVGLAGTVLAALGAAFQGKAWGQALLGLGLVLKGADSVGNLASRDGGR